MAVRTNPFGARLAAGAVLTLALSGALGACSGDDSNDEPKGDISAGPTSDAPDGTTDAATDAASEGSEAVDEFVAMANATCEKVYADLNAATADIDPSDPLGAVDVIKDQFTPLAQELQDELNALSPPEELADDYDAALQTQQDMLDEITSDPTSLFSIDSSEVNAQFDELGLTSCGSASGE